MLECYESHQTWMDMVGDLEEFRIVRKDVNGNLPFSLQTDEEFVDQSSESRQIASDTSQQTDELEDLLICNETDNLNTSLISETDEEPPNESLLREFKVDKILQKHCLGDQNKNEYLVRWSGVLSSPDDKWISALDLLQFCPAKVKEFESFLAADSQANYALCSYDVQKILQVRKNGMTQQFLVKWEGYSKAYNSWEPASNLEGFDDKILDFFIRRIKNTNSEKDEQKFKRVERILQRINTSPDISLLAKRAFRKFHPH